jgi:hypothetical protein
MVVVFSARFGTHWFWVDARDRRGAGEDWFWYGTLALVVFNAGIAFFGEGVKNAVLVSLEVKRAE